MRVSDAARVVDQPGEVQRQALNLAVSGQSKTLSGAVRQVQNEMPRMQESAAREDILTRPLDDSTTQHIALASSLRRLAPPQRGCLITHPPLAEEALHLLFDLAALALRPTGGWWRAEGCFRRGCWSGCNIPSAGGSGSGTSCSTDIRHGGPPPWVNPHLRPLLVFGKTAFRPDALERPAVKYHRDFRLPDAPTHGHKGQSDRSCGNGYGQGTPTKGRRKSCFQQLCCRRGNERGRRQWPAARHRAAAGWPLRHRSRLASTICP